ncbi:MAG TPA: hypothetical protein VD767_07115 [Thermomicrobiales bacterium]|nr:hypothetical protein [Thermomicrobiales bacterium]
MFRSYVRPVAYHRQFEDRLLLRDEAGSWLLWNGESQSLTEVEDALARWLYQRPEIYPVSGPAMWFEHEALPIAHLGKITRFE